MGEAELVELGVAGIVPSEGAKCEVACTCAKGSRSVVRDMPSLSLSERACWLVVVVGDADVEAGETRELAGKTREEDRRREPERVGSGVEVVEARLTVLREIRWVEGPQRGKKR